MGRDRYVPSTHANVCDTLVLHGRFFFLSTRHWSASNWISPTSTMMSWGVAHPLLGNAVMFRSDAFVRFHRCAVSWYTSHILKVAARVGNKARFDLGFEPSVEEETVFHASRSTYVSCWYMYNPCPGRTHGISPIAVHIVKAHNTMGFVWTANKQARWISRVKDIQADISG